MWQPTLTGIERPVSHMLHCNAFGTFVRRRPSLLLACAFGIAGCAAAGAPYDEPYALVEAGGRSIIGKEFSLSINAGDGVNTLEPPRSRPLKPGKNQRPGRLRTAPGPSL